MTVRDVLCDAANFSGKSRIAPDSRALGAIRRALYTIFRDTGIEKRTKILAVGQKPITRVKILSHTAGNVESFTITGGAYAFEVCGNGGFLLHDRHGERRYSFDTRHGFFSGEALGGGKLEFFGDYTFTVFNLSDYPMPHGAGTLPDGSGESRYNLSELVPDFLALSSEPTDALGKRIDGIRVVGGVMHLPEEYTGEIYFSYFAHPTSPVLDEGETLDFPAGYEALIAPLVAAYLLSQEDPELSESCLKIYRDMLDSLPAPRSIGPAESYYCKSRWA